jgi:hypothetical protein
MHSSKHVPTRSLDNFSLRGGTKEVTAMLAWFSWKKVKPGLSDSCSVLYNRRLFTIRYNSACLWHMLLCSSTLDSGLRFSSVSNIYYFRLFSFHHSIMVQSFSSSQMYLHMGCLACILRPSLTLGSFRWPVCSR